MLHLTPLQTELRIQECPTLHPKLYQLPYELFDRHPAAH